MRCTGQAVTVVMCLDIPHDDVLVPQLRAPQHRLQAIHQYRVAAPVHAERLLGCAVLSALR